MSIPTVKYHLVKPPFLLKGSPNTEFIYKRESETETIKFVSCKNSLFSNNLIMLDSYMPNLLSEVLMLLKAKKTTNINDIIDQLEQNDPLNYKAPIETKIYRYKIYEFVRGVIFGLDDTKIWYGEPNIYKHFPVVKINNELIYYSEDSRKFIELLTNNIYFDFDYNSHQKSYNIGNDKFLNLRLQLCFKT